MTGIGAEALLCLLFKRTKDSVKITHPLNERGFRWNNSRKDFLTSYLSETYQQAIDFQKLNFHFSTL